MKFVYKILQFQFSVCPGSTAIFGHKSVTQPFSILKTPNQNLKPPKNVQTLFERVTRRASMPTGDNKI